MHVYCKFYCSLTKKKVSDLPTFLGLETPLHRAVNEKKVGKVSFIFTL